MLRGDQFGQYPEHLPQVVTKSNQKDPWEFDQDKYRWRHLIENFFAKLKQYRGIATRYDKRACAFLGAIHWVAAVIWLN
jgi:transposase